MSILTVRKPVEVRLPPEHFPPDFLRYWNEVSDPVAIRREMAALLLADLREKGPDWPTDRFYCLHRLLGGES